MNVRVDKEASNANDHCFGRGVCEISFWSRKDSNKGKRKAYGDRNEGCFDDRYWRSHSYDWWNEVGYGVD